jgi:hypothetical protein
MAPPPDEPPADGKSPSPSERSGSATTAATAAVPVVSAKGKKGGATADRTARPAQSGSARPGTATPTRGTQAGPGKGAGAATAGGAAAVGAARVTEAVRAARTTVSSAAARGPRRARLNLKRIDPWSVMKFSFAVSVVLFIVVIVATSVLYLALDGMGVWESINRSLTDLVTASGGQGGGGFRITAWGVIGTSMLIGAVNVVLFTALATLGAFIYNVCADLVGGVELTLAERD